MVDGGREAAVCAMRALALAAPSPRPCREGSVHVIRDVIGPTVRKHRRALVVVRLRVADNVDVVVAGKLQAADGVLQLLSSGRVEALAGGEEAPVAAAQPGQQRARVGQLPLPADPVAGQGAQAAMLAQEQLTLLVGREAAGQDEDGVPAPPAALLQGGRRGDPVQELHALAAQRVGQRQVQPAVPAPTAPVAAAVVVAVVVAAAQLSQELRRHVDDDAAVGADALQPLVRVLLVPHLGAVRRVQAEVVLEELHVLVRHLLERLVLRQVQLEHLCARK